MGRQDIASALSAEIGAPELVPELFDQPAIEIPKYLGSLTKVSNRIRTNAFGKGIAAQVSDGNGNPTFAELLLVDRLRGTDWDCAWYSMYGNKIIRSWPWDAMEPQIMKLPKSVLDVLQSIADARQKLVGANKATFHGIPDIVAWRQNDFVMIECKRAKRDRLRRGQAEWFQSAKLLGLSATQFGIYEWTFQDTR